jgi:hypothetical protein
MAGVPEKIISGGQTGADRGGLEAARKSGLQTGGTAPRGYRTEEGDDLSLKDFGRTRQNVLDADATLIFATQPDSAGTRLTLRLATQLNRPYRVIDPRSHRAANDVVEFLLAVRPRVLNVAGNRESVSPGLTDVTVRILLAAFRHLGRI